MAIKDKNLRLSNRRGSESVLKKISHFLAKVAIIAVLLLLLRHGESYFRVNSIRVEGPGLEEMREEIVSTAGIEKGMSIFLLREEIIAENIRRAFPSFKEVSINRNLPDEVVIKLAERVLAGYIETEGGYWLIDRDAYIFSFTTEIKPDYPLIKGIGAELVFPESPLVCPFRAEVLEAFFAAWPGETGMEVSEMDLTDSYNLVVRTTEGLEIWFGGARKMESKIRLIQYSISHLKNKPESHLDVRSGKRLVLSESAVEEEKEVNP